MEVRTKENNAFFLLQKRGKNAWIFLLLWLLAFILYIPAGRAGWVIDAAAWIYDMKHNGFWDFINRVHSSSQSFYQLFALQYIVCYSLWGMNVWMWSLMYISLHAVNACLLFIVSKNILSDSGISNSVVVSLCGAILFVICPHVSEVVIWKGCYHYLQGLLFILLILSWIQKYEHNQRNAYIWGAGILFFLSAFALEIFYLVPFFTLSLAMYYRYALGYNKEVYRKILLRFLIPQLTMLVLYFLALSVLYTHVRPHGTEFGQPVTDYLSKPVKYFFHIIFFARYLPVDMKSRLYAFCGLQATLIVFYTLAGFVFVYAAVRLQKISNYAKAMFLFYTWIILTIGFLVSVNFPGAALLVFYDRYTYFADGFIYTLLALLVSRVIPKNAAVVLFCIYAAVNVYFTVTVNGYWKHSAYINNRLLHDLHAPAGKTVVLLNVPENMNGVPMIGSSPDGAYKLLRGVLVDSIPNQVYDVASYNMITMDDGAHVTVINDSVIDVTLNQWGTWWWYAGHGAASYENDDYRLNMKDPDHAYELTLKHPADKYLILYEKGPNWKAVDMSKRNADQD